MLNTTINLNSKANKLFDKIEKYDSPIDAWLMLSESDYKILKNLNKDDLEDVLKFIFEWFITDDFDSIKHIINSPYKRRILELLLNFNNGKYYFIFKQQYLRHANNLSAVDYNFKVRYGFDLSDFVAAQLSVSGSFLSMWFDLNNMFDQINKKSNKLIFIEDYLSKVYSINDFDVSMWNPYLINTVLNNIFSIYDYSMNLQALLCNVFGFVNCYIKSVVNKNINIADLFDIWFSNIDETYMYDKALFGNYLKICIDEPNLPYNFCLYLTDGVVLNNLK